MSKSWGLNIRIHKFPKTLPMNMPMTKAAVATAAWAGGRPTVPPRNSAAHKIMQNSIAVLKLNAHQYAQYAWR